MAFDEPPIPANATSALTIARDQLVACVEGWGAAYWASPTIGHAGRVTEKFLLKQSGKGTRSIVTVLGANNERLSGGSSTQFAVRWGWFIAVPGTLENRTTSALTLCGEAVRLVTRSPWFYIPDTAFSRTPIAESVDMRPLYEDNDEKIAMSIWLIRWIQPVDLGAAGRAKTPAPVPLVRIDGTDTVDGEPNPDKVSTVVQ